MKKITRSVLVIIGAIVLAVSSGCKEEKTYKIGVSQCSADDWRSKMNDEIKREIMFHDDVEVEIRSAGDDNDKQISDIRYFEKNGFDIIIVSPNEAEPLTPVIRDVHSKGMPVIIFDRNIDGTPDDYTARIGVDDDALGKSAAHYALHLLGKAGNALEIYGLPGSTPAEGRHNGFVREFTSNGGTVLASVPGNWNKEDAVPVVDSLLDIYKDVDLIYAHNDRMAIGASEVARRKGRDEIRIIGIDAAPEIGIRAVADSIIDATFLYPTEGHRLIRTALAILKNQPYEKEQMLPLSSAVDHTNADILLLQNDALREETDKLGILKVQMDDYWAKHASQTYLFYASIVIIILLFGVVFLVLKAYWQHKQHQQILLRQNRILEEEWDKQRELNGRLQEATQSKLLFFTNVSHDLRTPLTLIGEPIRQLAEADNLTPSQRSLIQIANKNVHILQRLINQILDFRKYENGKLSLSLSETDMAAAIGEWMDSFYSLARRRGIRLALEKPEGGDYRMAVDIEKMERVFFNLLSNALKYTPQGGDITVSYLRVDDRFIIRVADTGQGISQRDLGNIFSRFFRADRVHPDGSGIGLSLSKAFVELHNGSISVESTLSKGSVFTVDIPVVHTGLSETGEIRKIDREDVETELGIVDSEVDFSEAKPYVLVIDDNKDIQKLLRELLKDKYNVLTASDGAEGIRRAGKFVPDLIICDVMMPGMDGLECCRRLKSDVSTSHIPVLMLTACSLDEQRVQGYDSGADGYLSKPFSSAVLASRCAALIENRKRVKEIWKGLDICSRADAPDVREAESVASTDIDSEFYHKFLEIFNAEMGNPDMNVDAIAAKMGFERSQFYRKIKALTNYSPVELMRKLRLERARHLLRTSEKSVSEIAYSTGFSTPAYFSKCYREAYSETPTETRASLKK